MAKHITVYMLYIHYNQHAVNRFLKKKFKEKKLKKKGIYAMIITIDGTEGFLCEEAEHGVCTFTRPYRV